MGHVVAVLPSEFDSGDNFSRTVVQGITAAAYVYPCLLPLQLREKKFGGSKNAIQLSVFNPPSHKCKDKNVTLLRGFNAHMAHIFVTGWSMFVLKECSLLILSTNTELSRLSVWGKDR